MPCNCLFRVSDPRGFRALVDESAQPMLPIASAEHTEVETLDNAKPVGPMRKLPSDHQGLRKRQEARLSLRKL